MKLPYNDVDFKGSMVKEALLRQHRKRLQNDIAASRAQRAALGLKSVTFYHKKSRLEAPPPRERMYQPSHDTPLRQRSMPNSRMESNILLRIAVRLYRYAVVFIDFQVLLFNILIEFGMIFWRVVVPAKQHSISGEIALVTGAGQGIGRALALELARVGAVVICVDVREDTNKETAKLIQDTYSGMAFPYVCDVSVRESVEELQKAIKSEVGDVSILVNNAGVLYCRPFLHHSPRQIENIIQTNLMGQMWMTRAFLPRMIEMDKGMVVAMCSIAGHAAAPNMVPYSASKFAVNGLFESLRQELRQLNPSNSVHIMTVSPFVVETGMVRGATIRFPDLLNIVSAKDAATNIIDNLRRRSSIVFIPGSYYYLYNFARLLPTEIQWLIMDFIDSGIDVHYDCFDDTMPHHAS